MVVLRLLNSKLFDSPRPRGAGADSGRTGCELLLEGLVSTLCLGRGDDVCGWERCFFVRL